MFIELEGICLVLFTVTEHFNIGIRILSLSRAATEPGKSGKPEKISTF